MDTDKIETMMRLANLRRLLSYEVSRLLTNPADTKQQQAVADVLAAERAVLAHLGEAQQ